MNSRLLIAVSLLATLTGCIRIPDIVTLSLGPKNLDLEKATVLEEPSPEGQVLLIDIAGIIAEATPTSALGVSRSPIDELVRRLDMARDDGQIVGVVLRINSPGGGVGASDTMYREIRRFGEATGKPIVATMGEVAASGGYYIALAADEIVAPPAAITGSIGVIVPTMNVSDGMARIGLSSRAITSGPNKDIANPLEPIDEAHYEILQSLVDEFYEQFVSKVRDRRPSIEPSDLDLYTDGRIVTGVRAVEVGLADSSGGVREAHAAAKRLAGVTNAELVKLAPSVLNPSTPYASVQYETGLPKRSSPGSIGAILDHLESRRTSSLSPGVYYLWLPPTF